MRKLAGIVASILLVSVLFFAQRVGATFGGLSGNNIVAETAIGLVGILACFAVAFVAVLFLAVIWKSLFEGVLSILRAIATIFGWVSRRLHPEAKR